MSHQEIYILILLLMIMKYGYTAKSSQQTVELIEVIPEVVLLRSSYLSCISQ